MIKIGNEYVQIMQSNKIIYKGKNRLTDYFLDYVMWLILPTNIGNTIYSGYDFANTEDLDAIPFPRGYLKFTDTQTINDTDTTMDYDIKSESLWISDIITEIGNKNIKTISTYFGFDISSIASGNEFTGIGFGRDDSYDSDYLFSFVDISLAQISKVDGMDYFFQREDYIQSNETPINGDASFLPVFSPGYRDIETETGYDHGKLNKIALCTEENGEGIIEWKNLNNLVFTRLSAGIIEISGFKNYNIGTFQDYPQEDYPQEDYPQSNTKIKSVRFRYSITEETKPEIDTYLNLIDLDYSYDNKEFKIKLKVERGDY